MKVYLIKELLFGIDQSSKSCIIDIIKPIKLIFFKSNQNDRVEMHDFCSRFLLFILLFFFPLFLGGERKGEDNNRSRFQKAYLSA